MDVVVDVIVSSVDVKVVVVVFVSSVDVQAGVVVDVVVVVSSTVVVVVGLVGSEDFVVIPLVDPPVVVEEFGPKVVSPGGLTVCNPTACIMLSSPNAGIPVALGDEFDIVPVVLLVSGLDLVNVLFNAFEIWVLSYMSFQTTQLKELQNRHHSL